MRVFLGLLASVPSVQGIRIIMGNDDGWAGKNIRVFYDALTNAGQSALISAPAEDNSGTGSSDAPPKQVGSDGCQFNSCPGGSPPTGFNASEPRFNYVNSYPVTAIKYGIQTLSSELLGGAPELMVSGPNAGSNLWLSVPFSGTVGAAVEATNQGIPAIAFSGATDEKVAWNAPTPNFARVYADLALNVTETLVSSGTPYLPDNVWLNVNFPASTDSECTSAAEFKFVLSRINPKTPFVSTDDVRTCGRDTLPTEADFLLRRGCYASISVGDASDKTTATADKQAVVLEKLGSILSCLP